MKCHGCYDGSKQGWVDSQAAGGPVICPICEGSGELPERGLRPEPTYVPHPLRNKNPLLAQFEQWLASLDGVSLHTRKKTMNGYYSPDASGRWSGLVWVYTRDGNRIYLRKGDYSPADKDNRVIAKTSTGKEAWGGYKQFIIKTAEDLEYAKRIVNYAQQHL